MADDIDDLLNEVEANFCDKSKKTGKIASKSPIVSKSLSNTKAGKGDSELSAMIDDIFDDGTPLASNVDVNVPVKSSDSTGSLGTKRCNQVYLGGSSCSPGLATAVSQRTCNQLRCLDCDFKIVSFDNFSWDKSVDYLFLRNNIPEFERLKSKLVPRKGSRAYACQCKSISVKDLVHHQEMPDVRPWFCGKH